MIFNENRCLSLKQVTSIYKILGVAILKDTHISSSGFIKNVRDENQNTLMVYRKNNNSEDL